MKTIYLILLLGFCSYAQHQNEQDIKEKTKNLERSKSYTWEANDELSKNNMVHAEANYRRAISKSSENAIAPYNLGNTYYTNERFSEAFTRYKQAGELASGKKEKHKSYHNMGNVFMKNKEYQKAVDAYKEALRNDPTDEETRYNLALAQEMLKKQEEENKNNDQNQDNKDQEDKKDEDKQDKKEGDNKEGDQGDQKQDENKEEGDKGDQGDEQKEDKKESEGNEEQKKEPQQGEQPGDPQQQQPRPNQLSPQQIKNILEAMQNEEKNVQEKLDAQKVKEPKTKNEKDW